MTGPTCKIKSQLHNPTDSDPGNIAELPNGTSTDKGQIASRRKPKVEGWQACEACWQQSLSPAS